MGDVGESEESRALVLAASMACYVGVPRETIEECERVYGLSKAARLEALRLVRDALAQYGQFKQWCEDHCEDYQAVLNALSYAYGDNSSNRSNTKFVSDGLLSQPDQQPQDTVLVPKDELAYLENMANWAHDRGYGGEIPEYGEWGESEDTEEDEGDDLPSESVAEPTEVDWPPEEEIVVEATPHPEPAPLRKAFSVAQWAALDADERGELIATGSTSRATLNKQETDSIEWARWSWNPVTGCLHNCPYCYARDFANRIYEQGFTPTFLPDRLGAPAHQQVPVQAGTELGWRNIFTCSMADLFGKWVPAEWIEAVLDVARANRQWNFLFLTKFPNRLSEFTFPDNAWLGTSVDCQARVANAERSFARVRGGVKWLSVEPMLEPLHFESLEMFDWVVIGGASASSQTPAWNPPRRWVDELEAAARDAGCMIYEKTNLGARWREYPGWERPEPSLPEALAYLPTIGQGA